MVIMNIYGVCRIRIGKRAHNPVWDGSACGVSIENFGLMGFEKENCPMWLVCVLFVKKSAFGFNILEFRGSHLMKVDAIKGCMGCNASYKGWWRRGVTRITPAQCGLW